MKQPCIYISTNRKNGTLYTGVTSDIDHRMAQHKGGTYAGFSLKHGCTRLVWFEFIDGMETAILQEKRIKKWRRSWKIALIEERNPNWNDLALMNGRINFGELSQQALALKAWEMGPGSLRVRDDAKSSKQLSDYSTVAESPHITLSQK